MLKRPCKTLARPIVISGRFLRPSYNGDCVASITYTQTGGSEDDVVVFDVGYYVSEEIGGRRGQFFATEERARTYATELVRSGQRAVITPGTRVSSPKIDSRG